MAFVAPAVAVAACSPSNLDGDETASTASAPPIDLGEFDPAALVLHVTSEGLWIDADCVVLALPAHSLYTDGTLLVPGSMPTSRALQPILQPVDSMKLEEADLDRALTLIDAIGLPSDRS